jgi:hypothetical protein
MSEHDDAISRSYRGMAREEPPVAIDAAILAASRRAVGAGPRRNRWAVPVSLAAVLVLGVGIALRMQVEQPGIETSLPATTSSAEYPVAEPPVAVEPAAPAPPAAVAKDAAKPSPRIAAPARKAIKPADLPPEAVTTAQVPAAAPAPAPAASAPAPAAPAPEAFSDLNAQRRQPAALAREDSAPAEQRARREAGVSASATIAARPPPPGARDARVVELERIARLRAENRHDEADKALEAFRKQHPQYEIPAALWERVRPR